MSIWDPSGKKDKQKQLPSTKEALTGSGWVRTAILNSDHTGDSPGELLKLARSKPPLNANVQPGLRITGIQRKW